MSGLFICGTDTDAGKTVATVLLGQALLDVGVSVDFYKPVQSGGQWVNGKLVAPDVEWYKAVLPTKEKRYTYLFETPSSPHYAAAIEGTSIDINKLTDYLKRTSSNIDCLLAEGAGGLYVPLDDQGICMIDLIENSDYPAIVVARTGVGTINHTLLTVEALRNRHIPIGGLIFSNTEPVNEEIEADNIAMITKLTNLPTIGTIPYIENLEEKLHHQHFRTSIVQTWKIEHLKEMARYANSTGR